MAATNIEVWQQATVVEATAVTEHIKRIVLRPDLPRRADPGSHIDVKLKGPAAPQGEALKRSYSVVESADDGARLTISVFRAPSSRGGSVGMHALRVGDSLEVTQPLQNFPLRVGAPHYLLLAGGIGITAIAAMGRVLHQIHADYTLVYAGRSRAAMAYLDELQQLHGHRLVTHINDEGTNLDVASLVGALAPDTELYMCGPIRLMDSVRRSWLEKQLNPANLRFETFGNSGWYAPQEFTVRIPRLGIETTVGPDRSMLEALEDAGADMMFDCRKGECGLCEVRVLRLEGAIDHRDVFYSERQQKAAEKICCCVSRVASVGGRGEAVQGSGEALPSIVIEVP
jgi:vanillate O-demethylase ferredoxin subunit